MLTNFSKWLLYGASYGPAYAFLMIEIVLTDIFDGKQDISFGYRVLLSIEDNSLVLLVLLALCVFSALYSMRMSRWKNNTKIHFCVSHNITFETTGMLATYILPMISCGFNLYIALVWFLVIWLAGIAFIKAGYVYLCCIFLFKRYYIFSNDEGMVVITRKKMERYNLELRDTPNGLEARQICRNIFLICDK